MLNDDREFIDDHIQRQKKAVLRKMFREGYTDPDGKHVRYVCIESRDPETGRSSRGYKQVEHLTVEEWSNVIRNAMHRAKKEHDRAAYLFRLMCDQIGEDRKDDWWKNPEDDAPEADR